MKKLTINNGKMVLLDNADFERLKGFKYDPVRSMSKALKHYVFRQTSTKRRPIAYDVLQINPKPGYQIDHINGNTLDNRRSNLRVCSIAQNQHNQLPRHFKGKTSKFKGVYFNRRYDRFIAQIGKAGKRWGLGYFTDEKEAAKAYDAKARKLFGEYARTNF